MEHRARDTPDPPAAEEEQQHALVVVAEVSLHEFNGLAPGDAVRAVSFWVCCRCETRSNPMPAAHLLEACLDEGVRPCPVRPGSLDTHVGPCQSCVIVVPEQVLRSLLLGESPEVDLGES